MKISLLSFFFLTTFFSNSQYEKIYNNDSTLIGLKNYFKDTVVFNPQFIDAKSLYGTIKLSKHYFWVSELNEKQDTVYKIVDKELNTFFETTDYNDTWSTYIPKEEDLYVYAFTKNESPFIKIEFKKKTSGRERKFWEENIAILDTNMNFLLKPIFYDIEIGIDVNGFSKINDCSFSWEDKKEGLIDSNFKVVVPPIYKYLNNAKYTFDSSFYIASNHNYHKGLINKENDTIIPLIYSSFSNETYSYFFSLFSTDFIKADIKDSGKAIKSDYFSKKGNSQNFKYYSLLILNIVFYTLLILLGLYLCVKLYKIFNKSKRVQSFLDKLLIFEKRRF